MTDQTDDAPTTGVAAIIDSEEALELAELFGEPFTAEWRLAHAISGDAAMSEVAELFPAFGSDNRENDMAVAAILSALAQVAQAHYAAANVRAKPIVKDAPRPAPADKSWLGMRPHGQRLVDDDRKCFVCGGDLTQPWQAGGGHAEDCAGAERLSMQPHGSWPVKQTPTGRVVIVPAGTELSADELTALAAVNIEVRWEKEKSWQCARCGSAEWVAAAAGPDLPAFKQCVPCGSMRPHERADKS